jgi:glycosyltransferase involved in cell wall biosynthesis
VLSTLRDVLPRRNWDVHVLSLTSRDGRLAKAMGGGPLDAVDLPEPPTLAGGVLAKLANLTRTLTYARRHSGVVADSLADVAALPTEGPVLLQTVSPNLLPLVGRVGERLGLPIVWDMPNTVGDVGRLGLNRRFYDRLCRRHDVLPLANSRHTADSFRPGEAVDIVQPMTDEQRFDPRLVPGARAELRRELDIADDAPVIGLVTRLTADKGAHLAIDAVTRVNRDLAQPFHLLVVGEGESAFLDEVRRRATEADGRVHVLPATDEPRRIWAACDIGLNSRVSAEPFGLSVIEAMMMGCPVVAHGFGGPAETVADGVTGWLAPQSDPPRLADALTEAFARAAAERAKWPRMARAARARTLRCYSARVLSQKYVRLAAAHARAAAASAKMRTPEAADPA